MSELYSLLQNSDVETDRVRQRRLDALLPHRRAPADLAPVDRTVPQLRSRAARKTTPSRSVVHGADLNTAIQRVAQFADERSRAIRMKLDKNELKISSSSTEAGESEDSIEIAYSGDAMTIGFNSEYLIDFLKAVERRRSTAGVQGRAVRRPDAPRRRQRRLQVPLRRDADADLRLESEGRRALDVGEELSSLSIQLVLQIVILSEVRRQPNVVEGPRVRVRRHRL